MAVLDDLAPSGPGRHPARIRRGQALGDQPVVTPAQFAEAVIPERKYGERNHDACAA